MNAPPPPAPPVVDAVYALMQLISDPKRAKGHLDAIAAASAELEKAKAEHLAAVSEHERHKAETEKAHTARDADISKRHRELADHVAAMERELTVKAADLDAREKILAKNEETHRVRLERLNSAIRNS